MIESFIWIVLAVGVPSVFILACLNMKPHASHVWEFNREMEKGILRNEKGQVISLPRKWWEFWK